MTKKVFNSKTLAQTNAPYSQATILDNTIFLSGQVAMDPKTGSLISGNIEDEAAQVIDNLSTLLKEMGSSLDNVLKVTVFLNDMNEFQRFNEVYKTYFKKEPPARSCVEVGKLPFGASLEIEAIAHL